MLHTYIQVNVWLAVLSNVASTFQTEGRAQYIMSLIIPIDYTEVSSGVANPLLDILLYNGLTNYSTDLASLSHMFWPIGLCHRDGRSGIFVGYPVVEIKYKGIAKPGVKLWR